MSEARSVNRPPLGPVPYLPPVAYCADHQGDRYSGDPCPNCRPLTDAERAAHRAEFDRRHPSGE